MRSIYNLAACVALTVSLAACATTGGVQIPIPGTNVGVPIPSVISDPIASRAVDRKVVVAGATSFDLVEQAARIYVQRPVCPKAVTCRDPNITRQIVKYIRQGIVIRKQMVQFALDHPGQLGDAGLQDALDQIVVNVSALLR